MRELLNRLPRQHKISGAHRASGKATRNLRSVVKPSEIIKMQKGSSQKRGEEARALVKETYEATYQRDLQIGIKAKKNKSVPSPEPCFYDATMKLDTVALCLVCDASAL